MRETDPGAGGLVDEVRALRAELAGMKARQDRGRRALAALAAVLLLAGADRPPSVVRADRVEIPGADGEPAIVLAMEGDTPAIRVLQGDDLARLTAVGLEVKGSIPPPEALPKLEDAGLTGGEGGAAWVDVGLGTHASAMEVICDGAGFRERSPFVAGRAVIALPDGPTSCVAIIKGGLAFPRVPIKAGDRLMCAGNGLDLRCRNLR